MIVKKHINKELNRLDKLYRNSLGGPDPDLPNFYAKLALLELCGWIEVSMDNLILSYPRIKRLRVDNKGHLLGVVHSTYSFEYGKFKKMLINLVGIIGFDRLEKSVDIVKKSKLQSVLQRLKPMRDDHAHTLLSSSKVTLNAPSVMKALFVDVYEGLIEFESELKRL